MSNNHVSGSLAVEGNENTGHLFFHDGRLTFALLDGEDIAALGVSHIDADCWLEAMSAPGADVDLSETLALVGVPPADIAAFAHEVIDRVVRALHRNDSLRIELSERPSPIGGLVRFDVSEWFETIRPQPGSFGVYRLTRIA